jgi:hypothetical protein
MARLWLLLLVRQLEVRLLQRERPEYALQTCPK